jgi:hypothetical protein
MKLPRRKKPDAIHDDPSAAREEIMSLRTIAAYAMGERLD